MKATQGESEDYKMQLFLIGVFGILGVFSRYGVGLILHRGVTWGLPVGTFVINVLGSFLIGFVYILSVEKNLLPRDYGVALMGGFLGGFTTFSAFSLETLELFRAGQSVQAVLCVGVSCVCGVLATAGGF